MTAPTIRQPDGRLLDRLGSPLMHLMHLLPLPVTLLIVAYPFSMIVGMIVAALLKWWGWT